jgi:hypothetical protein
MSWMERLFYMGVVFAMYCLGRMHGENREHIHRAMRSQQLLKKMEQRDFSGVIFHLQDDMGASTFRSYTRASFGPNLWQKPISNEKIEIEFKDILEKDFDVSASNITTPEATKLIPSLGLNKEDKPLLESPHSSQENDTSSTEIKEASEPSIKEETEASSKISHP